MRSLACFALGALALAACGGGGGGGGGTCSPRPTASLTINDTGFSGANNACVQLGGAVAFNNTGSSTHSINFDTPGCPAPGQQTVAVLANSTSGLVTFPSTAVNCSFHIDTNTALSGTVAVTSVTVTGGY
jgi:hypothetical protein